MSNYFLGNAAPVSRTNIGRHNMGHQKGVFKLDPLVPSRTHNSFKSTMCVHPLLLGGSREGGAQYATSSAYTNRI